MRNVGALLIILGLLLEAVYWIAVPMSQPGSSILNIGLIADREVGMMLGISLSVLGSILFVGAKIIEKLETIAWRASQPAQEQPEPAKKATPGKYDEQYVRQTEINLPPSL